MPVSKSRRKGKVRRPRVVRANVGRMPEHLERELMLDAHARLLALRTGHADAEAFDYLAVRVNIGFLAAHLFYADGDAPAVMVAGRDALLRVLDRANRVGRWGGSGEELRAIGEAIALVDTLQLDLRTPRLRAVLHYMLNAEQGVMPARDARRLLKAELVEAGLAERDARAAVQRLAAAPACLPSATGEPERAAA